MNPNIKDRMKKIRSPPDWQVEKIDIAKELADKLGSIDDRLDVISSQFELLLELIEKKQYKPQIPFME